MAQETNQEKVEKPELNALLNQRYGFIPSQNSQNQTNAQGWDQNEQNLLNGGGINDLLNSQTMQDEMFDLSLLDAKEKKKLKKKQRKRDKKIK